MRLIKSKPELKRFLISTDVANASGTQTWRADATTKEEAMEMHKRGDDDLYSSDVEVTALGEPEFCGVTTLDDFGDMPPPAPAPVESKIVSNKELAEAFTGTNFGTTRHRELLNVSVLKKLVGYHCGHTITTIMTEMKLIGKTGKPTKRGVLLVREAYNDLMINQGG